MMSVTYYNILLPPARIKELTRKDRFGDIKEYSTSFFMFKSPYCIIVKYTRTHTHTLNTIQILLEKINLRIILYYLL